MCFFNRENGPNYRTLFTAQLAETRPYGFWLRLFCICVIQLSCLVFTLVCLYFSSNRRYPLASKLNQYLPTLVGSLTTSAENSRIAYLHISLGGMLFCRSG